MVLFLHALQLYYYCHFKHFTLSCLKLGMKLSIKYGQTYTIWSIIAYNSKHIWPYKLVVFQNSRFSGFQDCLKTWKTWNCIPKLQVFISCFQVFLKTWKPESCIPKLQVFRFSTFWKPENLKIVFQNSRFSGFQLLENLKTWKSYSKTPVSGWKPENLKTWSFGIQLLYIFRFVMTSSL